MSRGTKLRHQFSYLLKIISFVHAHLVWAGILPALLVDLIRDARQRSLDQFHVVSIGSGDC